MPTVKKILFISYDGMTDPLGQSQVIPYLAGLVKFDYHFTILSCDKPTQFRLHRQKVNSMLRDLPIKWISLPYHKNPPVLSSVFDYLSLRNAAVRLHRKEKFDMVHTRPGIPTLVALWLKRRYGIKFLNDVRGFWADERVDGGMWDVGKLVYKKIYQFFKKHELDCLSEADGITCLTNAARHEMLTWKNVRGQPLKIEVIPCSADLDLFDPAKIDKNAKAVLRQKLGLNDNDIVFSYLGSIGGWYLTKEMMQFCRQLSNALPAAKFLFISPHRHNVIMQAAREYAVPENKIVTFRASRTEVPLVLSLSKYSFFFIKPCYSKLSSSPTKHGEIMAMGIPVITNDGIGDVSEIVHQSNSGIVLKDLTLDSMTKAVSMILSEKTFNTEMIREAAGHVYALEKAVAAYAGVYAGILR